MVHSHQKAILDHLFPEEQEKKSGTFNQATLALVGDHELEKTWMAREICEYSPVIRNSNYVSLWLSLDNECVEKYSQGYARLWSIIIDMDLRNEEKRILLTLDGAFDESFKYYIVSDLKNKLPPEQGNSMKIFTTQTISMPEYIANHLRDDLVSRVDLIMEKEPAMITMTNISELLDKNSLIDKCVWISMTDKSNLNEKIERQLKGISTTDDGEDYERIKKYVLLIPHDVTYSIQDIRTIGETISGRIVLKVLSSRSRSLTSSQEVSHAVIPERNEKVIDIKPFSRLEFDKILSDKEATLISSVKMLFDKFFGTQLPAAVALMISDVNKIIKANHSRIPVLENLLREAANYKEADDKEKIISEVMQYLYDMLPSDNVTMINCMWHSRELFLKHGSIHYNELITYWIMEGYFDFVDHIEEAYEEGHHALMELEKRSALKFEEDGLVSMERLAIDVVDHRRNGGSGTASLGLMTFLEKNGDWQGLGRVEVADGMITTPYNDGEWEKVSTLLMDGSRLCREVPEQFFKPMKGLNVLVLLKPILKSLEFLESVLKHEGSPLSKLRVLVLRGCDMLENIDHVKKMESLEMLEISGARSLKEIPDEVFGKMPKLRSLNLSALPMKYLPSSFSKLKELRWLILRDCSCLEQLPSLKAFKSLQVVDMSGTRSLAKFEDEKVDSPVEINHEALTHLSLGGRDQLNERSTLKSCTGLQILDLSGNNSLKEISIDFLATQGLRILDMSKTKISRLPSNLSNLTCLEFLELSDMCCSDEIEKIDFANLKCLRHLNLSNTKIRKLQSLCGLGSLGKLLLRGCQFLEELPQMEGLDRLEMLDLSGACSLRKIQDPKQLSDLRILDMSKTKISLLPSNLSNLTRLEFLDLSDMSCSDEIEKIDFTNLKCLRHLNLSNTEIKTLQPLRGLGSLGKLLLRHCQCLEELPQMEGLDRLEKLDLSGAYSLGKMRDPKQLSDLFRCLRHLNLSRTKVRNLPSLSYHGALCELLLRDCRLLEQLPDMKGLRTLEKLDLSGSCLLKEIPDGESLSHMRNLRQLLLSNCMHLSKLPVLGALEKLEVLNLYGCISLTVIEDKSFNRSTSLLQLDLWDTYTEALPASLSKLFLRNCINLEELPSLESLTNLQELDLCGATSLRKTEAKFLEKMTELQFLDLSRTQLTLPPMLGTKLSRLSLSNCSNLNQVPLNQLEKLNHLETLNLSGIEVKDFPYWVSNLIHLKSLYLPDLNEIPQFDWGRIKRLPDVLNWDECGMFANFDIHRSTRRPSLTISSTEIFHYLFDKDANIWDKCFEGFHVSLCSSSNISREDRLFFCPSDESSLQEIHFKSLSCPKGQEEGSVEIRGYDEEFPAGVEEVLKRAVYIFLTRNKFIKHLSDMGKDNMTAMKGLWLDGCANMENIFSENEDIIKLDQSFEILWVSNLVSLVGLFRGNVQVESFKNLKQLHLDCCPKLENVFSPRQLPENLEILQIKFCCRLKCVFQPYCADFALRKLRELHLLELPEFVTIGAILPSIQSINIRNCPSLESSDSEIDMQTISRRLGLVKQFRCTVMN